MSPETTRCTWADDEGWWETSCGHAFVLNDGTPTQNGMAFCCYCGKPIEEVQNVES